MIKRDDFFKPNNSECEGRNANTIKADVSALLSGPKGKATTQWHKVNMLVHISSRLRL